MGHGVETALGTHRRGSQATSEKTVAANVRKWGTGAINIDDCRVGTEAITQHGRSDSQNVAMAGRNYAEAAGRSWQGCWPANVIHDGSDEVLEEFRQVGGKEKRWQLPKFDDKLQRNLWKEKRPAGQLYSDAGTAARFFYLQRPARTIATKGVRDWKSNRC